MGPTRKKDANFCASLSISRVTTPDVYSKNTRAMVTTTVEIIVTRSNAIVHQIPTSLDVTWDFAWTCSITAMAIENVLMEATSDQTVN